MEPELKQRLVGASVIIALAVIFIPMIFDDTRINQNQTISIEIPDEPTGLKRKVLNIDTTTINDTVELDKDEPSDTNVSVENTNLDVPKKKPVVTKEETIIDLVDNSKIDIEPPEVKKETVKPVEIKKEIVKNEIPKGVIKGGLSDNSYRVKYGVFSEEKNAQQLKAKIINAGYKAVVEKEQNNKVVYKVFSRFFDTKKSAENVSDKIQKLKLNIGKPSIETLSEEEMINSEAMLDTGWIIQIGIFSSKENSIKLRDKIRNKKFVAFVDEMTNSKNQHFYRVRVGPYATRDEAEKIKVNIKKVMNLKGITKPHEKQKVVN